MADQTLLNYIEQVYTLESEQYTLGQMIDTLKRECSTKRNQLQEEVLIVDYDTSKTIDTKYQGSEKTNVAWGTVLILLGFYGFVAGIVTGKDYPASEVAGGMIVFIVIFIAGILLFKRGDNAKEERLQAEKNKQDDKYELAQSRLNNVKKQNEGIRAICAAMEEKIKELEIMQSNKKSTLQSMYDFDILHKSYRNLYGVSKIFHLLDTGICETLTGVDGAYSQMRTDQIIDNQKISIKLQNDLVTTNRMMYNAVNRTNELLGTMNQQMNIQNANNTQLLRDIKDNLEVSNFLMESGNSDRKALAASAEYIAYAEKQKRLSDGHFY